MKTPGVDPKLQQAVRDYYADKDWAKLAVCLEISRQSVRYQLTFNSPRDVTYNFLGLLAVKLPCSWDVIFQDWRQK